jgi:sec-independent protein translocase protein TatA
MPTLGIPELMIVLVIVVLLFGASRLPQLGKSLGEGIRFFRQGVKGDGEGEQEKLQD